jgi:Mn2+/Fe2+ NRAMP family transporter
VILSSTVVPHIKWTSAYWYVIVGILGTTISPYMFFWQASEEVEERRLADQQGRKRRAMRDIRTDNANGMIVSQLGSWFMMVTTASVLHRNGILTIGTAADAAKALQPLVHTFPYAGTFAKAIFALGIVGMGLLGIPVLAGSASFAVSEVFGWREGLESRPRDARAFYAVITVATLIGLLLTLAGIDPIRALIFAAVVNGVVAVPLVFLIRRIATDRSIMGPHVSGALSRRMLMLTFIVMLFSALVMFVSLIAG